MQIPFYDSRSEVIAVSQALRNDVVRGKQFFPLSFISLSFETAKNTPPQDEWPRIFTQPAGFSVPYLSYHLISEGNP